METNAQGLKYAGFWRRFGAHLIDTVIWMIPLFFINHYVSGASLRSTMIGWSVASLVLTLWYHVALTVKFGGTPGFRLLKAKIRDVSGAPVGYRGAVLRFIVLYLFSVIMTVANIIAYRDLPDAYFVSSMKDQAGMMSSAMPSWMFAVSIAMQVWMVAEFIVLLSNKQRRVISDFIAGTVVLQDKDPTDADAKTDFVG